MIIKLLHIVILASVKYILTLPYAMIIGVEYKYAILAVLAGGIGGFLFFYYLSKPVNRGFNWLHPRVCAVVPNSMKLRFKSFCDRQKPKKKRRHFSRKNRFIVRVKTSYGFWGIIIATPVILTIPIGAFLANKYYGKRKHIVKYMIVSIVGWAGVLSGLIHLFPKVFF
ncbi:hypothetical protein [Maribellus sediminis]|uniref:hypothetical protein n=1 Tax=Maribellus sediminis TaxID=2696285 RepID=UPI00142FD012|nr:hypothetical protein [Maribellus sediminis]